MRLKACSTLRMRMPKINRQLPKTNKVVGMLEKELLRLNTHLECYPFPRDGLLWALKRISLFCRDAKLRAQL